MSLKFYNWIILAYTLRTLWLTIEKICVTFVLFSGICYSITDVYLNLLFYMLASWDGTNLNNKLSTSPPTISLTFNILKCCHNQDMFRCDQTIAQWK
jgi:hypothetical protein